MEDEAQSTELDNNAEYTNTGAESSSTEKGRDAGNNDDIPKWRYRPHSIGRYIHMRVWLRAGKPDPLILLVAREPLLRASVKASLSLFTVCHSFQLNGFSDSPNRLSLPYTHHDV